MNTNNRLKVGTITLFIIMFIFIAFTNSQAQFRRTTPTTTTPTTTTPKTTTSGTNVYYIDYVRGSDSNAGSSAKPWKLCPGMKGFVGKYTHQAGDTFIFKSSVTWPSSVLPLTIQYSGSSGKIDTYKGDSTTMPPVFDGGGAVDNLLVASKKSYFTIEGIMMINAGLPRTSNSKNGLSLASCSNFTISKCTLKPEAKIGIYVYTGAGTYPNIIIQNNDISSASQAIVVCTTAPGSVIDNVTISGNKIHDLTSQIGGGVHGDGIHTWASPSTDNSQYITNLKISNNYFYGSFARSFGNAGGMTALIYLTDTIQNAQIMNNVLEYPDPPVSTYNQFMAMINFNGNGTRGGGHVVTNNLVKANTTGNGIYMVRSPNCKITNNVFTGVKYAYDIDAPSTAGMVINNNIANVAKPDTVGKWGGAWKSWTQWQALGNDVGGSYLAPSQSQLDTSRVLGYSH